MTQDDNPGGAGGGAPLPRYTMIAELISETPLTAEEFAGILAGHRRFLAAGGAGGTWVTFVTAGGSETGLILGIYRHPNGSAPAGQADLQYKRLDGLDLRHVNLSYAAVYCLSCRDQNLAAANLQGCLMTDSDFTGSAFRKANLAGADLSRSELAGCDFREADLRYADLENADLTGADLRGARLEGIRLPGARLDGARGLEDLDA